MPIGISPDQTYPVYLRTDCDKPEAERPAFLFRYLTVRKAREVDDLMRRISEVVDRKDEGRLDMLDGLAAQVMAISLAGWRNIRAPYSLEALDDVVTWGEKWELIFAFRGAGQLAEADLKKSASAARSAGESSVTPALADAKNLPAETTPPASHAGNVTVTGV